MTKTNERTNKRTDTFFKHIPRHCKYNCGVKAWRTIFHADYQNEIKTKRKSDKRQTLLTRNKNKEKSRDEIQQKIINRFGFEKGRHAHKELREKKTKSTDGWKMYLIVGKNEAFVLILWRPRGTESSVTRQCQNKEEE